MVEVFFRVSGNIQTNNAPWMQLLLQFLVYQVVVKGLCSFLHGNINVLTHNYIVYK